MTGGEVVAGAAAGKALSAAGKHVGAEQKAINKELLEVAKQNPGFEKAAQKYGQRQAVKQQILLNLYKPLAKIMGVSRDYFAEDFAADLAARTTEVPEEDLITPKASIAGPAMEGLGYSLDEPDLKNLYLELLARASDGRVASQVHPSFTSIIRELTEAEARYLQSILPSGLNRAMVRIRMEYQPGSFGTDLRKHVLNIVDDSELLIEDPQMATFVDNWARLGLVEIHYDGKLRDEAYAWVDARSDITNILQTIDSFTPPEQFESVAGVAERGYLGVTEMGKQFAAAVGMTDPAA